MLPEQCDSCTCEVKDNYICTGCNTDMYFCDCTGKSFRANKIVYHLHWVRYEKLALDEFAQSDQTWLGVNRWWYDALWQF